MGKELKKHIGFISRFLLRSEIRNLLNYVGKDDFEFVFNCNIVYENKHYASIIAISNNKLYLSFNNNIISMSISEINLEVFREKFSLKDILLKYNDTEIILKGVLDKDIDKLKQFISVNENYSYIPKPKEEKQKGKKPSERYLEKLKQQGKSPTPEADKIEQEKIKKRVLENITQFREETYGEDNRKDEKSKQTAEEPQVSVFPFPIEIDGIPTVLLYHQSDIPRDFDEIIRLLWKEGYLFNENKWDLTKAERTHLIKRLLQFPLPNKYDIQYMIGKIRGEKYSIFLSEEYLKQVPKYTLGAFIRDITKDLYEKKGTEEEFLEIIHNKIPKKIFAEDRDLYQFLSEMKKVINPTPRQRIKGMDRLKKHWNLFLYSIQLDELQNEIDMINSNYFIHQTFFNWAENEFVEGFRLEHHPIPVFFDIGFGENIIPKYTYPLLINPKLLLTIQPIYKTF